MTFAWTAEQITRLTELVGQRYSASQIAEIMGTGSRNSIIGKVRRLNLQLRSKPGKRPAGPALIITRRGQAAGGLGSALARKQRVRAIQKHSAMTGAFTGGPVKEYRPSKPILAPQTKPVSLMERTEHQCTWVVGETAGPRTMFCGADKPLGEMWCRFHEGPGYSLRRMKVAA